MSDSSLISLKDYQHKAKNILKHDVYNYIAGAAEDEKALRHNEKIFDLYQLYNRVLTGFPKVDTSTSFQNFSLSSPILVAPMAYHKLAHPEGEMASIKASQDFGTICTVSTFSSTYFPKIFNKKNKFMPWLQLYLFKDRSITKSLIQRAQELGIQTVILTVDAPIYGKRPRDLKSAFELPDNINPLNLQEIGIKIPYGVRRSSYYASLLDPSISWKDVEWLNTIKNLNIYIKGITHPEDSKLATQFSSVKGIILSNHGGRQLECAPSGFETLGENLEMCGDKVDFFVDGGIRKGSDIFKSLALGAKAIFIGRPILWGLAVNGSQGVYDVLNILQKELQMTMHLCGYQTISTIDKRCLRTVKTTHSC